MRAHRAAKFGAAAGALVGLLTGQQTRAQAPAFVDVTQASGLQAARDLSPADIWLSGTHLIDFDGDGDLDFFYGSHGGFHGIYGVNDGHGHFTTATLPQAQSSEIHLISDLDENGLPDVTFTEDDGVTRWHLGTATPGMPAFKSTPWVKGYSRNGTMGDMDGDGNVDWICGGGQGGSGNPEALWIYFGDGKGSFRKDPQAIVIQNVDRDTTEPIAVDLDGDGDLDLSVKTNLLGTGGGLRTFIYRNDGAAGGKVTLTPAAEAMGLTESGGPAIIGYGDIDQDGDTDIIGRDSALLAFINDGHGRFTKKPGLVTGDQPKSDLLIASMTDLDNDGVADLVVGGFMSLWLFRGTGGGAFVTMNGAWGVTGTDPNGSSRVSFAFGDVDGDGDLDLVGPRAAPPKMQYNVYRNDLPAKKWLNVRPIGHPGNKVAMGAAITVYEAGTDHVLWFEEIRHHGPQIMQNTYSQAETERHFGLGDRATVDVAVHFHPSNKVVTRKGVSANTTVKIAEDGSGTVVPPAVPPSSPDAGVPRDAGSDAGAAPTPDPTGAAGTSGSGGVGGNSGGTSTGAAGTGAAGAAPAPVSPPPLSGAAGTAPGERGNPAASGAGCACTYGGARPSPLSAALPLTGLALAVALIRRRKRR